MKKLVFGGIYTENLKCRLVNFPSCYFLLNCNFYIIIEVDEYKRVKHSHL